MPSGDYIYCVGFTTNKVWKIRKSDMVKVAESIAYGGIIRTVAEDENYVYCAGDTTQKVWKIQKSDMSKVAESADYGGIIYHLVAEPVVAPPVGSIPANPKAWNGYLCFMEQYIKNKVADKPPLKLPDGTLW